MRFQLRRFPKDVIISIFILLLSTAIFITLLSFFYDFESNTIIGESKGDNYHNTQKSEKITNYIKEISSDNLIDNIDFENEITSIILKKDGRYESHIFDYDKGNELSIMDVIKEETRDDFFNKIEEMLYLKYPSFIADVLSSNNGINVYCFFEAELVIYYYDYKIEPNITEDLFLNINYKDISDFLNFKVKMDDFGDDENKLAINQNKKLISITFDDGPSGYTKELVDILDANKVNATFFMVTNKLNNYRDTVLYVHNHHNEIGYHSYNHKSFKKQNLEIIKSEFDASNSALKDIIGTGFSLTRPPYGAINDEVKNLLDTSFILWNVDTEDWRHHDVDYLVNYVLSNVKEGDIVLFHDMYRTTIDAIKIILPELYARGFQVVTVSELAKSNNAILENHNVYRFFK